MADANEGRKIRTRADALEQLAGIIENTAIASERGGKGTLADYVRLVQLEGELRGEESGDHRKVFVQWLDQNKTESSPE